MPYTLFEPHPSVPRTHYMGSGRGGAGNIQKVVKTDISVTPANPPASRTVLPAPPTTFMTGRGGAGNLAHAPSSERAIFSFDEELVRDQRSQESQAPVYYIGRGGAGNYSYSRGRSWSWEHNNRNIRSNSVSTQGSRGTIDSNLSDRSDRSVGSKMGNAWTRFSQTIKGQT